MYLPSSSKSFTLCVVGQGGCFVLFWKITSQYRSSQWLCGFSRIKGISSGVLFIPYHLNIHQELTILFYFPSSNLKGKTQFIAAQQCSIYWVRQERDSLQEVSARLPGHLEQRLSPPLLSGPALWPVVCPGLGRDLRFCLLGRLKHL